MDIGTRPCTSIDVVKPESVWMKGYNWMRQDVSEFPMMSADEVKLLNRSSQSARGGDAGGAGGAMAPPGFFQYIGVPFSPNTVFF